MKKVKLCVILACCATLLLTSCSNMLDSLEKAAETKESTKTEKSEKTEETGNPENTQPLPPAPITPEPQNPVTPPAQNPEENKPQEQNPENQQTETNPQPEQQQTQEQQPETNPQPEQQQPQEQQPEQQPPESQNSENQNPPEQNPVTPPNDTPQEEEKITYTIKHYKQNIEDDNYTLIEDATEIKELTKMNSDADVYGKGLEKEFEGFNAKLYLDSNNTVTIKYERLITEFTFDADGGKWSDGENTQIVQGKYGAAVSAPANPTKITDSVDYKFTGWNKTIPTVFGTEAQSFKASWEVEKTLCKIEHFKQNLENDEYTKVTADTQEIKLPPMSSNADVTFNYTKNYAGFEFSDALLDLGEDALCYYYDRKTTAITFNPNGGKFGGVDPTPCSRTFKYGSTVAIAMGEALWPSRTGYDFGGWAYSSDATTGNYGPNLGFEVTDTTPSAVTLYAIWRPDASTSSTLTFVSGGDVTVELSGNSFHAQPSIAGTYTYEWYLNNVKQSSETDTCSIDIQNLAEGFYTLVVKATSSTGIVYVSQYSLPVYGQAQ